MWKVALKLSVVHERVQKSHSSVNATHLQIKNLNSFRLCEVSATVEVQLWRSLRAAERSDGLMIQILDYGR